MQFGLSTKITDASPRPIRPISSGKPITATFKPIQTTRDTQDQETKRCETSSIGLPKTAVLAEERTDATPEFHTPTNIQASSSCSSRASTPSTSSPNSTFSTEVFYETQEITDRPFPYTELSNVASTASRASRTPSPGSTPPIDRSEQTSSRSPILMPAFCHPTQTKRKDELTEQIRSMIYLLGQLSKDDRAFSNIDTKDLLEIKSHLASPLQLLLAQIKK